MRTGDEAKDFPAGGWRVGRVGIAAVVTMLVFAACSKSAPPYALPSDIDVVALKAHLAEPRVAKTERATLSVASGEDGGCTGWERTQSKVVWRTDATAVKVEVSGSSDSARQLFAMGSGAGEAETGAWVGEGTHFFLIDASTGKQMAELRIEAVSCAP